MDGNTLELVQILMKAQGFVSGEVIAQKLGVSRTAIWKKIKAMRDEGFHIESQPNLGYCLISCPDRLLPALIKPGLETDILGRQIYYYPVATSTNTLAKEMAAQGACEGTLLIAEEQTQGRGRMGRSWLSPAGKNLLFSLILRPPLSPVQISFITMLSALAVVKTIRVLTSLEALIKWPNDVMINHRKVGGILTEFSAEQDQVIYVILGIGVNLNFDPTSYPEIAQIATSIYLESGQEVDRIKFLHTLLGELEKQYKDLLEGKNASILQEWRSLLMMLNKEVEIISNQETLTGWAEDVDEYGALVLRLASGNQVKIYTGDVSLRTKG
jgi:BirA family biotin operon repressor/biotin-[acetyl-CoA-carboxylase] ligase